MHYSLSDIQNWNDQYRNNLIHALSGYHGVFLLAAKGADGHASLLLIDSVVNLGASQIGFVIPQQTTAVIDQLRKTKCCTINHVHKSFLKNAHYANVALASGAPVFETCNLVERYEDGFQAPFVGESKVAFGLELTNELVVPGTDAVLFSGAVKSVYIDDVVIETDGQIDLETAHDVCVTGTTQYSTVSKFRKMETAELEHMPDFKAKERPDNVVFDKTSQTYNASLLPYGTSIGAPKITETGVSAWKNSSISNFNHSFNNKIESLKKTYQDLIDEYRLNEMLYQAKISFEPIIGQVYYLYRNSNVDECFLSLIPPSDWKKECLGSFKLSHDKIWQKVLEEQGS